MLYVLYRYALPANVLYLLAISNKLGNQVRPTRSMSLQYLIFYTAFQ